jgi:hypothetical protein
VWDGACSISKCIPVALKRNLERALEEGLVRIPLKWLRRRHVVKNWQNARVLETSAQCCWLSVNIIFWYRIPFLSAERESLYMACL